MEQRSRAYKFLSNKRWCRCSRWLSLRCGRTGWDLVSQSRGKVSCLRRLNDLARTRVRSFRYDPTVQRWIRITSMGTKRLGVAVAVLDGHLYAIGGSDGQSPLNTGTQTTVQINSCR